MGIILQYDSGDTGLAWVSFNTLNNFDTEQFKVISHLILSTRFQMLTTS